jgi:N-acetylmuramic acid 6-phosphate etherase
MLPVTEQDNPNTAEIDTASTLDAVRLINDEDQKVAAAVRRVLTHVAEAVDRIVERLENGGRLFYIGTGTSGRLGVLDASEIPPTYGVSPDLVQGVIAGGYDALYKASEASEDDGEAGVRDLRSRRLQPRDAVVGIAASGRTPYTIHAVRAARVMGCFTACIACVPDAPITKEAEIAIVPVVGPEVITGSTRMKAGTAQKLILNMISTMAMVRLGYVSGNRMVSMRQSNEKLRERGLRILIEETGLAEREAKELLACGGGDLRVATLMHRAGVTAHEAAKALESNGASLERAAESLLKGE